jgi:hypothetical protein
VAVFENGGERIRAGVAAHMEIRLIKQCSPVALKIRTEIDAPLPYS